MFRAVGLFLILSLLALAPKGIADANLAGAQPHIVLLNKHVDPAAHAGSHRLAPKEVYVSLRGYAVQLNSSQLTALKADPRVRSVRPDHAVQLLGVSPNTNIPAPNLNKRQEIPTGVRRIGGLLSPTAKIDGRDERVNVDVAVIDTGLDANHPDLNVVATKNCVGKKYLPDDHGTHVAATVGAIDNGFGVVGVAPGARIWSVRIFDANADTTLSVLLCAIDYVAKHAGKIEVVNMSAAFLGFDGGDCGLSDDDPFHAGICELREQGILVAAAAGNSSEDTASSLPAAYDETIAVSALTDYDGAPGGLSPVTCFDGGADDTLAWYSNVGPDVDIAAPGTCILSGWWPKPNYEYEIGTSMSAPHVAGAIALYKSAHPNATADEVEAAILQAGTPGPVSGDVDGFPEPLLNVAGF
jgi:subtilisin family serine protease